MREGIRSRQQLAEDHRLVWPVEVILQRTDTPPGLYIRTGGHAPTATGSFKSWQRLTWP